MKMKFVAIIVLVCICQAGFAQYNVNQLFKEFSKEKATTKVSIGKIMMSFAGMFGDTMGVDGIEVLEFSSCDQDTKDKFSKAIRSLKDSAFETMINSNENGSRTKVLVRIKEDTIHELVVLTSGDDPAMVRIKGKIKKSDIEKLVAQNS